MEILRSRIADRRDLVRQLVRAGADGFLLKDVGPDELLRAIRLVAAGEALLAPSITPRLIAEFAARPDPQTSPEELAS